MAPRRQLNLDDEADFLDLLERFYSTHPAHEAARQATHADGLPVAQTVFLSHLTDIARWAWAERLIDVADYHTLLDHIP